MEQTMRLVQQSAPGEDQRGRRVTLRGPRFTGFDHSSTAGGTAFRMGGWRSRPSWGEANASASSCEQTMRSWWVGHRRSGTATALEGQELWVGRGTDATSAAASFLLGLSSLQDNES